MKKFLQLFAVGATAGAVNGLFGTGGGSIMVFGLLWLLRDRPLDGRILFANVCAAVLPMAVISALTYSSFSPPDPWLSLSVGASALVGGTVGAFLLGKLGTRVLKLIFAAVMTVGGVMMIFR